MVYKIPYEILYDVLEHRYFQRLQNFSNRIVEFIFRELLIPDFIMLLGAMHLMFTALETLKLKNVKISDEEEKAALLAILLHDVGHGPYSHALESLLMEDWHHENFRFY